MAKLRFTREKEYWYGGYRLTPDQNLECELPKQLSTPSIIKDILLRFRGEAELVKEDETPQTPAEPEQPQELKNEEPPVQEPEPQPEAPAEPEQPHGRKGKH